MAISVNHPDPSFSDPVERIDPSRAGHPWWRYERPAVRLPEATSEPVSELLEEPSPESDSPPPEPVHPASASEAVGEPTPARQAPAAPPRRAVGEGHPPSAVAGVVGVVALIFGTFVAGHGMRLDHVSVVTFPLAGIVAALAFGKRCRRLRPDEPWLPRLILLGTLVKIGASTARYITFAELYNSVGDAFVYDREARQMVRFWAGERPDSVMEGLPFQGSNVIRWLTAWLYEFFGQNLLAAFLLFGLLALLGAYFWYRALADAVPYVDKRLLLIFLLFAPSIIFWPAALGKEALMQTALGAMAWATSLALRGRLLPAAGLAVAGGIPLYFIRPHLLALVTVAAAVPLALGRVRSGSRLSSRPFAMLGVGLLVVFTVTAGTRFVGLEDLSVSSVEENLDAQTEATSYGGSSFSHPGNSLTNPLFLPIGVVTVLFRPFIFEASGLLPLLTAIESSVLIGLVVLRRQSLLLALRRWRQEPFVLYCALLLLFYGAVFSALANFGLLTRQRSLVLPALYALIACSPALARRTVEGSLPSVEQLVPIRAASASVDPPDRRRAAHPVYRTARNGVAAQILGDGTSLAGVLVGNGHGNGAGNGHAPVGNGHGNGAGNGHAPVGNGHGNGAGNGHAPVGNGNGHGNGAGNGHAPVGNGNGHGNGAGNGHAPVENGAGNGHAPVENGAGNGHAPVENGNGHGNGAGNGHAPVENGNGHGNGAGNGHAPVGNGNGHGNGAGNGHAPAGNGNGNGAGNGHAPVGNGHGNGAGNGHAPAGNGNGNGAGNGHAPVENGAGRGHAPVGNGNGNGAGNGHAPAGNGHAPGENGAGNGHAPAGNGHAPASNGSGNGHAPAGDGSANGHSALGNGHAADGELDGVDRGRGKTGEAGPDPDSPTDLAGQ